MGRCPCSCARCCGPAACSLGCSLSGPLLQWLPAGTPSHLTVNRKKGKNKISTTPACIMAFTYIHRETLYHQRQVQYLGTWIPTVNGWRALLRRLLCRGRNSCSQERQIVFVPQPGILQLCCLLQASHQMDACNAVVRRLSTTR